MWAQIKSKSCRPASSLPGLILRNVSFAIVILTTSVTLPVSFGGAYGPMRIGKVLLHLSQLLDEIDALHCNLLLLIACCGGWTP